MSNNILKEIISVYFLHINLIVEGVILKNIKVCVAMSDLFHVMSS